MNPTCLDSSDWQLIIFSSLVLAFDQQASNQDLWNKGGGYLNLIHDSRNELYMRFYVGQSFALRTRIPYHIHQILLGSTKSPHYFLLAMGERHRYSSFLKLWDHPALPLSELAKREWDTFFGNILETVFCCAFQSLSAHILTAYLGPSTRQGGYADNALNIIPPMLQGSKLSLAIRGLYVHAVAQNKDVDIRVWEHYRQSTIQEFKGVRLPALAQLTTSQWQDALDYLFSQNEARKAEFSSDLATDTEAWVTRKDQCRINQPSGVHGSLPYGNPLRAKVGFVFDDAYFISQPEEERSDSMQISLMLKIIGFDAGNSLIWSSKLHEAMEHQSNHGIDDFLGNSCLKVVFCCGGDALRTVSQSCNNHEQREVRLGPFTFKLWLSTFRHERLFVYSPELSSRLCMDDCVDISRMELLIDFACKISSTSGISLSELRNISARVIICRQARKEANDDVDKWTTETLPLLIRVWLFVKGQRFKDDEAVKQLQATTGSLTRALLTLLHVLPHRPDPPEISTPPSKGLIAKLPQAHLDAVAKLRTELRKKSQLAKVNKSDNIGTASSVQTQDNDMQSDRDADPGYGENDGPGAALVRDQLPDAQRSKTARVKDQLHADQRPGSHASPTNPNVNYQHQRQRAPREMLRPWQIPKKIYKWHDGNRARTLWETDFKTTGYKVRIPKPREAAGVSGLRCITFANMSFYLPLEFQPAGGYMFIHPEFSPEGTRHEHVFATSSGSFGHAQRLALRLEGTGEDDTAQSVYAHELDVKEVRTAEDFVACLLRSEGIKLNRMFEPRRTGGLGTSIQASFGCLGGLWGRGDAVTQVDGVLRCVSRCGCWSDSPYFRSIVHNLRRLTTVADPLGSFCAW